MMMAAWSVAHDQQEWRKGPWTPEEDKLLKEYVNLHGEGRWSSVARSAGLKRSGKSCRLRWVNYLRPGLRRGHLTPQEEAIVIELHALWGNKWATIARYLPGRTDNEIKNYWRTHFKKRPKPSQRKGGRRALPMKQPNQENGTGSVIVSPEPRSEVMSDQNSPENHGLLLQQPILHPNTENPGGLPVEAEAWPSDTLPLDGLWGWLWNFDDDLLNYYERSCNKINGAGAPYCFGFDGVDKHQMNQVYK